MKIGYEQIKKKTLRCYSVSKSVFDDILDNMATRIQITDNIGQYFNGYPRKHTVMYDNKDCLIIREHLLAYFADFSKEDYQTVEDWRQVIVRKDEAQTIDYNKTIDGSRAYKFTKSVICKDYTEAEYDKILHSFEAEYDPKQAQFHFNYPSKEVVLQHDNCIKYDINGAYHAALIEIFPKSKQHLQEMFDKRKEEPIMKAYVNYFVGMLVKKGYRKTFNWIVQRTSKLLKKTIAYVGGDLIYANTDGFMVSNPERKLKHSKKLGEFKLEYEGTAYTYQDKNYWCYQAGSEVKGSLRYSVRDQVNLSQGIVCHYDLVRVKHDNGVFAEQLSNITQEQIDVYKES